MKKQIFIGALFLMALTAVYFVSAAPSPNGPGQPSMSCEDVALSPPGFLTDGFAHAGDVYAGTPGTASALHANSNHAVSQYDVACYQFTLNHQ